MLLIGVLAGMKAEAALLPRSSSSSSLSVACSGGSPARAVILARRLLGEGAAGLISFGIAGGLAPGLRPGALVVGHSVFIGAEEIPCDPRWRDALRQALPHALSGPIAGADEVAANPAQKAALHQIGQALAVDLETASVARICRAAGKPFAVLRAIADPYDRGIPDAALAGLDETGETRPWPVILRLARQPLSLPGLIRVGLDSKAALNALAAAAGQLGPTLGFQTG